MQQEKSTKNEREPALNRRATAHPSPVPNPRPACNKMSTPQNLNRPSLRRRIRTPTQILSLVAEMAVAGLDHSTVPARDRADFYEGLSSLLPKAESEAAKYAATCIRESQRAQREFLATLESRRGAA